MSRTTTATAKGVARVTLKCIAPKGIMCRGRVDLDFFGAPAGSAAFRLNAGKTAAIPFKLRPKVWRALQKSKKKRLSLNVTLAFRSAGKLTYKTGSLTVLGARVRQKQGTPPHK